MVTVDFNSPKKRDVLPCDMRAKLLFKNYNT